ncbi:MAG TPA: formate dehydrogenase accessory sulfurtransferase FdhD [Vicinamibacteria bacterium]|nr:formate dehydrogenase accessory sulfurtransferase FdhD [Vicinamibacteria bacterium]
MRQTNARAASARVARLRQEGREEREDRIAVEEPLEIRLGGKSVAVVMRTPGEDHELAAGFLFTEGILAGQEEVDHIAHCRDPKNPNLCNVIDVTPKAGLDLSQRGWQRNFVSSSSCGLCGKLTIESVHLHAPALDDDFRVSAGVLLSLPERLRSDQAGFDETGGLHAAGLFDKKGRLLLLREDIGRHNAVDKIIGAALLKDDLPLGSRILMVSGRTSFEIVQKALMARIPFVAAVSAASSLAVELAESSHMGLVGFLRGGAMNAYAGANRIVS